MMDEVDHLLDDADDLMRAACSATNKTTPCGLEACLFCEWRARYLRFRTARENGEYEALAQRIAEAWVESNRQLLGSG